MFHLTDDPEEEEGLLVAAIHDERGYKRIRAPNWRGNTMSAGSIRTSRSSMSILPATGG